MNHQSGEVDISSLSCSVASQPLYSPGHIIQEELIADFDNKFTKGSTNKKSPFLVRFEIFFHSNLAGVKLQFKIVVHQTRLLLSFPTPAPVQPASYDLTAPANDLTASASDLTTAANDLAASANNLTTAANNLAASASVLTAPAGDLAAPANDLAAPAGDLTAPASDLAAPANDLTAPASDLAAPANDLSRSNLATYLCDLAVLCDL